MDGSSYGEATGNTPRDTYEDRGRKAEEAEREAREKEEREARERRIKELEESISRKKAE